jgi:hypothetical protein
MALPNGALDPERRFQGQRFVHHRADAAGWLPWHGGEAQETGVAQATGRMADARVVRPGALPLIEVPAHEGELVFGFVLDGAATLEGQGTHLLGPTDAFVVPPGEGWCLRDVSADFRLLHVTTGRIPD